MISISAVLWTRLRRALLLGIIFAIPIRLSWTTHLVNDPDIWWHLRTGAWIAQHAAVPRTDPFSILAGQRWTAYSWIFELIAYALYRAAGLFGIVLYQAVVSVAIVVALYFVIALLQPGFLKTAGLTAVGAIALSPMFQPRPWLFTILFFILEMHVVLAMRKGNPRLWWTLPLIFAAWANIHIQFVYGLLVLVMAAAEPVIARVLGRIPAFHVMKPVTSERKLWLATGLSALATLATPYNAGVYRVVREYAAHSFVINYVDELQAMNFRSPIHYLVLGVTIVAAISLGRRRVAQPFPWMLFATSVALSFRLARDVWFVIIVAVVLIADSGDEPATQPEYRPSWREWSLIAGTVVLIAVFTASTRGLNNNNSLERQVATNFPAKAADFVAQQQFRGPIYNDFNWGGYLIWRLPQYHVSLDNRTNLYGDQRILRAHDTWLGLRGWTEDSELAKAGVVIGNSNAPLSSLLRQDRRFRFVYEDENSMVFVKTPANE